MNLKNIKFEKIPPAGNDNWQRALQLILPITKRDENFQKAIMANSPLDGQRIWIPGQFRGDGQISARDPSDFLEAWAARREKSPQKPI